ncbi:hypothetical protein [Mucilaginibacter sp.]|uniref:hypothetical protein n=1 Tax=Mucilaginibacter sp. TaxID=1882438 RepID=UPI0035BC42E6
MMRNNYFDNHPFLSKLKYQEIVGLIQLLTDSGFLSRFECNGHYVKFIDLRKHAMDIFEQLGKEDIKELIDYLRYKAYLDYSG